MTMSGWPTAVTTFAADTFGSTKNFATGLFASSTGAESAPQIAQAVEAGSVTGITDVLNADIESGFMSKYGTSAAILAGTVLGSIALWEGAQFAARKGCFGREARIWAWTRHKTKPQQSQHGGN